MREVAKALDVLEIGPNGEGQQLLGAAPAEEHLREDARLVRMRAQACCQCISTGNCAAVSVVWVQSRCLILHCISKGRLWLRPLP